MKTMHFLIMATVVALVAGCAVKAPNELISARFAYQKASQGPAEKLAPAELHKAQAALVEAEQSFKKEPKSSKTKDLAYVAQRKSELAGALGAMAADKRKKEQANVEYQKQQGEIIAQGKQDLIDSERQADETFAAMDALQESKDKAAAEKRHAETLAAMTAEQASKDKAAAELQKQQAEQVKQGKQDLSDSEKQTAVALAELARIAAVKEEERGLVVTLSGSILFRSNESTLLSSAQVKLDQVAQALLAVRERNLIVEGHTDSQGSGSYNQDLSQRRANTVRDYLVQKDYPADHIQARGKGEGSPIADNASPEGRANNRRVEIVIEHEAQARNR